MKEMSKAVALAQRTQVARAPAVMAPAMVRRDPASNLAAATSRLRQLGVEPCVKTRLLFQTNQKTGEMTGWREASAGTELTLAANADLPAAVHEMDTLLAPPSANEIEAWLVEVSTITARRAESEAEGMLTLTAYSARLSKYPADIVRATLLEWSGKWFPTWSELKEILDARAAPRLSIREALVKALNPPLPVQDVTPLKRELARLEDGNIPREWAFKDRSEQLELIDERILELKTQISQIER